MDDTTEAEKKSLTAYMTNPDRTYCEGRFLSLAAELARMGYKHRTVAQAALTAGLAQAMEESSEHYSHYVRGLGTVSKTILEKIDEIAD